MNIVVRALRGRRPLALLVVAGLLVCVAVVTLDGRVALAAGGSAPPISNAPALLPCLPVRPRRRARPPLGPIPSSAPTVRRSM